MNIREWFGSQSQYNKSTDFNQNLDNLLNLYMKAVTQYFKLKSTNNVQDMIESLKSHQFSQTDNLFINWLISKGFPSMRDLANMQNVESNEESIIGEINYQLFILQEEMDFEYPEDVRASLISISTDLQYIISNIQEETNNDALVKSINIYKDLPNEYTFTVYKPKDKNNVKKIEYFLSIEEPAEMQVLFSCSI